MKKITKAPKGFAVSQITFSDKNHNLEVYPSSHMPVYNAAPKLLKALKAEVDSLEAMLQVDSIMDALEAPDAFGAGYKKACEKALIELQALIKEAGG